MPGSDDERPRDSTGGASPTPSGSLMSILRRRIPTILLAMIVVAAAVSAFAYHSRNDYKSTAQILFQQTDGPELNALGLLPVAVDSPTQVADDTAQVASREVARAAARALGSGVSTQSIVNEVAVVPAKAGEVVNVTATTHPAARAAKVANAYTQSAVSLIQARTARRARATANALSAQLRKLSYGNQHNGVGGSLRIHIAQLRTLEVVGTGSPQIIQRGFVPTSPSSNLAEVIVLGVVLGALLGVGLALLREQVDQRLRHSGELSEAFGARILATVPNDRALAAGNGTALRRGTGESLQMLQANLRYGSSSPPRSLIVTSTHGREGKTTVAWNLAVTAASSGLSVVLMDGDLRRSSLAATYGLQPFPGLSEVLEGSATIEDAIQSTEVAGQTPTPQPSSASDPLQQRRAGLDVLIAGTAPPDPFSLLQSVQMSDLLERLRRKYDLVIVDTPPIAHVADAIALLHSVDGVLVVASALATRGPEAESVRNQLTALDARILGIVVNRGSRMRGYKSTTPRSRSPEPAATVSLEPQEASRRRRSP
jgi:capsular exopolysaccharide synthesis family protein